METSMMDCIKVIDENTRFWMIRTKQGFFFDEFVNSGYIAIGWNNITEGILKRGMSKQQEKMLKEELSKLYDEKKPGTALNKCSKFYNDFKNGDIVVIVGNKKVGIAEVGDYYEESKEEFTVELEKSVHNDIEHYDINRNKVNCPYVKRRKIKLLKLLNEKEIVNPYFSIAISVNRHSLSEIKDYVEVILSNSYEVFVYKNKLTLAVRVEQNKDIDAMAFSGFIYASSKFLGNENSKVTVKTALHSPGDILLQVQNYLPDADSIKEVAAYFNAIGSNIASTDFKLLVQWVKDFINRDYNKKLEELDLRSKEADINLKIAEANKYNAEANKYNAEAVYLMEKRKQLEDERDDKLRNCADCLSKIAESSGVLKAKQPFNTKIIDFYKKKDD